MILRERTAQLIRDAGRAVIGVFPEDDDVNSAFCYSIGNAIRGLPELLIVGMFDQGGVSLINLLSEKMIQRGDKFDSGEMIDLGGAVPVCAIDATDEVKDIYTIQATNYYGNGDYAVMQMVLPDKHGRFPWDADCAAPYGKIRVYRRMNA
jgi:Domain of unknown function (DUF4262)